MVYFCEDLRAASSCSWGLERLLAQKRLKMPIRLAALVVLQ